MGWDDGEVRWMEGTGRAELVDWDCDHVSSSALSLHAC